MKWVDIPPVWLLGALALAWWQPRVLSMGLSFGGSWKAWVGAGLVLAGLGLMAMAFVAFRQHRTSVVPHQVPKALITTGIFARTRNPIYLGDVLILAGCILRWDAVLSVILVPIFVQLLVRRFILDEEARLQSKFPEEAQAYWVLTRRWL